MVSGFSTTAEMPLVSLGAPERATGGRGTRRDAYLIPVVVCCFVGWRSSLMVLDCSASLGIEPHTRHDDGLFGGVLAVSPRKFRTIHRHRLCWLRSSGGNL